MSHRKTPIMLALGAAFWAGGAMADTPTSDEMDWFHEAVQECIAAPDTDACEQVRSVVEICSDDPTVERCGEVFQDARMIFDSEDRLERAEEILASTAAQMPGFDAPETDDLPSDALEEARDDAERQLLRTDDNQMTHSTPPLSSGEPTVEIDD